MNKHQWSDDERAEYDLVVITALANPSVPARRDIFLRGLDISLARAVAAEDEIEDEADREAKRAQFWGPDVLYHMRARGADSILKTEQNARNRRVPVAHNGQVLGKVHRFIGARKRDDDGAVENQRQLFDFMTWDQLREKLPWYAAQRKAYEIDTLAIARLLELEERVPEAKTPTDACKRLGITVEQWLAGVGAA
jgi:hypothetical protein